MLEMTGLPFVITPHLNVGNDGQTVVPIGHGNDLTVGVFLSAGNVDVLPFGRLRGGISRRPGEGPLGGLGEKK